MSYVFLYRPRSGHWRLELFLGVHAHFPSPATRQPCLAADRPLIFTSSFHDKPGEVEFIKRLVVKRHRLSVFQPLSILTNYTSFAWSGKTFVIWGGCNGFPGSGYFLASTHGPEKTASQRSFVNCIQMYT